MRPVARFGMVALTTCGIACGEDVTEVPLPLVDLRSATTEECAFGGTSTRVGFDDDADGTLDDGEVTDEIVTCNGAPGRGSLIDLETFDSDEACPSSGYRIRSGLDDNDDAVLQPAEVDGEAIVCRGEPGIPSLIRTRSAGAECPSGSGVILEWGLDDDASGQLDDMEVDQQRPLCDGTDAPPTLVLTERVTPGDPCPRGGQRITTGVDDDGDGTLSAGEVDSTAHLCDPADNLLDIEIEDAATSTACPESGGLRLESGLDEDGDGALAESEVGRVAFVCNGIDGAIPLVIITPEGPGANCAGGGQKVEVGDDDNRDGALDMAEVDSTAYVCDGQPAGPGGAIRIDAVEPGADCVSGGVRIETGPDRDGDGILDEDEVNATELVCNGAATLSVVAVTDEPAGANCPDGGVKIESGLDANSDGSLNPTEIQQTAYVCDANASIPFIIRTAEVPTGIVDLPYRADLEAVGGTGGGYVWTLDSGALPPGMRLIDAPPRGRLEGSPSAVGTYNFTVEVTDFFGQSTTAAFELEIVEDFEIESTMLDPMEVGTAYSQTLSATSSVSSWTVVAGNLPAGLSLDGSTGVISGTPTQRYGRGFVVEAVSATGATDRSRVLIVGDTEWGVYVLRDENGPNEVYAFSASGTTPGTPVRISPTPAVGATGVVEQSFTAPWLKWSSRARLAFPGRFSTNGGVELYAADLTGSTAATAVRVSTAFPAGREIGEYAWAADNDVLAYTADQDRNDAFELYVVTFTGSTPNAPLKINDPITGNFGNVTQFALSPDGQRIAFVGDLDTAGVEEVYYSETRTPNQVRVSPQPLAAVFDVKWSNDSRWLGFTAPLTGGDTDLHVVDTSSSSLPRRTYDNGIDFSFAPTSDRLVYLYRDFPLDDRAFTVELSDSGAGAELEILDDEPIIYEIPFSSAGQWNAGGDLLSIRGDDPRTPPNGNEPYLLRIDGGTFQITKLTSVIGSGGAFTLDGQSIFGLDRLYRLDDLLNPTTLQTPLSMDWRSLAYVGQTNFDTWVANRTRTDQGFAGAFLGTPRQGELFQISHDGRVGVVVNDFGGSGFGNEEYDGYFIDVPGETATQILPTRASTTDFRTLSLETPWDLR